MPPPEVGVLALQPSSVPLVKELVGRLAPYRSADVRARVPGHASSAASMRKAATSPPARSCS